MLSLMLLIVLQEVRTTLGKLNCTEQGHQTFKVNSGPDLSRASPCLLTFLEGTLCTFEFCAYEYQHPKISMIIDGKETLKHGNESICLTVNYTMRVHKFIIHLYIGDSCDELIYSHVCKVIGNHSNQTTTAAVVAVAPTNSVERLTLSTVPVSAVSESEKDTSGIQSTRGHKILPTALEVYWYLLLSIPVFLMISVSGTLVIVSVSRKYCFKNDQELAVNENSRGSLKSSQATGYQSQHSYDKKSKVMGRSTSDQDMDPIEYLQKVLESEVDTPGYAKDEDDNTIVFSESR